MNQNQHQNDFSMKNIIKTITKTSKPKQKKKMNSREKNETHDRIN